MADNTKGLDHLITIVARLRAKDGCPWDQKQTPQSIKSYLLEETHEALAAVDSDEPDAVKEELGDLLFLIVFLCQQYQEKGCFTMADALATINEKMTRRHPHVFGDAPTAGEEELRDNWLAMKRKEKNYSGNRNSPFSSIPKTLPALKRAQRISEIAAHRGFDWSDLTEVFAKLAEETSELKQAVETGTPQTVFEEFGDILLVLVNIGRMLRVKPEEALHAATEKFINRYELMEEEITRTGQSLRELDYDGLLRQWQAAKNN